VPASSRRQARIHIAGRLLGGRAVRLEQLTIGYNLVEVVIAITVFALAAYVSVEGIANC
jgi:hypothetical protein